MGCDICPRPRSPYPSLDTPQNAVQNVKIAWELRDSVRTAEVYANDYAGSSMDPSDSSTLTFTKGDEVHIVGRMRRRSEVLNVHVGFPPESTWLRLSYPGDSAGWTAIQIPHPDIRVDDAAYGTMEANADAFFEFKLKPTSVSGADTTWGVVRWTEIKQPIP